MNKVILIGNVAADPETRVTQSGITQCVFRLAVPRRQRQDGTKEADFLTIVCWRQLAELCGKYLRKGRRCAVDGSIQSRSYTAQDGSRRYVTEIIAENVEFLNSPAEESVRTSPGPNNVSVSENTGRFEPVDFDDLPF